MRRDFFLLMATALSGVVAFERRPNVVFILTDDQDVLLEGMTPMEKTRELIAEQGITFVNAFATTPICCPSRSSILTGLYLHSHGTLNNSLSGGCSDARWQRDHEGNTFGAVLRREGYRTFYAGKYLNQYGREDSGGVGHVPEGWDWWIGLVGNSVYYNYSLSVNGTEVLRGDREEDYLTDVLRDYSLEFLRERRSREEPFLMVVSPPAPHEPFTPARRHKGKFSGAKAPRTANFNLPVNETKHWLLRLPPSVLPPEAVKEIDGVFRSRWESLLAVDELVQAIVKQLGRLRILNDTYVLFSSDHGFHLGQFGLPWDKRQPYETDIRIPLLVRGPEIQRKVSEAPVLTVDIAATILDMAGTSRKSFGDGRSFLGQANALPNGEPSRSFLIEYHGEGEPRKKGEEHECSRDPDVKLCRPETSCKCFDARNNTFTCLRRLSADVDDVYCEFGDSESFREFYDVRRDPHQMNNLAGSVQTEAQERILRCCRKTIRLRGSLGDCLHLG